MKYLSKSKVGLKSLHQFIEGLHGKKGEAWLIHNNGLTTMVERKIEMLNTKNNELQIKAFYIKTPDDLKSSIKKMLHTT